MSVLGLIPARGGSKRIPRKNIRLLGEHPLVLWTIVQAQESEELDTILVSTEDKEISDLCCHRCDVVMRPEELATDTASSYSVILHALSILEGAYEWVCLLQPTSPFRDCEDIDQCIITATESDKPAFASFTEGESVPNGAIYVGRTDWLWDGGNFDGPAVGAFWMPKERSLDIDTDEDWAKAEETVRMLGG